MTATDELRRMLDERGVGYETYIEPQTDFEHVKWNFNEHGSADFNLEFGEPWLTMYGAISDPEQAIDATLGRGTCRRVLYKPTGVLVCSECGAGMPRQLDKYCYLHYCPNCGARVVSE